jgi:hypothetical protein
MKVDLREVDGTWHAVVEREGQKHDVGGISELIRYLEALTPREVRTPRGLR